MAYVHYKKSLKIYITYLIFVIKPHFTNPGAYFNIKKPDHQCRNSYYKDILMSQTPYLCNRNPIPGKMVFILHISMVSAKRALPAMITHGRKGPFGRIPSIYPRAHHNTNVFQGITSAWMTCTTAIISVVWRHAHYYAHHVTYFPILMTL